MRNWQFALASAVWLLPQLALAHPGHNGAYGAEAGFFHPFSGLDHILAMVSVGLLAAQTGGRALWLLPISFVMMMGLGGAFGIAGIALPAVEHGIALSVIVLGAMVASGLVLPAGFTMALLGVFAVIHGNAHGAEMPSTASALTYGGSFMAATAILHMIGIAFYGLTRRHAHAMLRPVMQTLGGLIAFVGVSLALGLS